VSSNRSNVNIHQNKRERYIGERQGGQQVHSASIKHSAYYMVWKSDALNRQDS